MVQRHTYCQNLIIPSARMQQFPAQAITWFQSLCIARCPLHRDICQPPIHVLDVARRHIIHKLQSKAKRNYIKEIRGHKYGVQTMNKQSGREGDTEGPRFDFANQATAC